MVTILASIAQQESASISQNVRMGINFGFQEGRGRVNFSSFLGYRRGDKPGTYEIIPAEAEVVIRIYRAFLEGYSPKMIADGLMEDGICTPSGGEKWYPSTVASILENEKYAGDLLMQKWYVEDYLTHKCVKNSGEKPQYFVEDDHDPIVPKAVFYQVQGEKKRRSGLAKDPSKLRFGNRLALNGRLICGKCGRTLKRYVKAQEELTDWRCRQRALVKKTSFHENVESRCDCRIVREVEAQRVVVIRLLLELVDEMVKNSLPEWMRREAETVEETGACRDYDDFFRRTRYKVPEGVLTEGGRMEAFNNDLAIRYLDRVVVKEDGYEVAFKAGVTVEVEI